MYTKIKLIKSEFPDAQIAEFKGLTEKDKLELASAIARNRGLKQDECDFEFVEY